MIKEARIKWRYIIKFLLFFTLRIDGLLHCTDCICTENFRIVLPKNILNCKFSRQRYIKYDLVNTLDLILTPYFLVSFQFNLVCSLFFEIARLFKNLKSKYIKYFTSFIGLPKLRHFITLLLLPWLNYTPIHNKWQFFFSKNSLMKNWKIFLKKNCHLLWIRVYWDPSTRIFET